MLEYVTAADYRQALDHLRKVLREAGRYHACAGLVMAVVCGAGHQRPGA